MTEFDQSEKGLAAWPTIPAGTTKIELSDNALTEVPASIGELAGSLEELLVYKNKIKTIAPEIGTLQKLGTLNCFNNALMKAPPDIGKLASLEELNLCLLYTSPSPRDRQKSRMPSSA